MTKTLNVCEPLLGACRTPSGPSFVQLIFAPPRRIWSSVDSHWKPFHSPFLAHSQRLHHRQTRFSSVDKNLSTFFILEPNFLAKFLNSKKGPILISKGGLISMHRCSSNLMIASQIQKIAHPSTFGVYKKIDKILVNAKYRQSHVGF